MKRIHDSLTQVLSRHRLVFWYDGAKEWEKEFEAFSLAGVEKICVEGTEFGTKVRILRHADPNARFLLFFPAPRPADADNWLLDLLLQGHEYKADRASLALQEAGLSYDFQHVVEQHLAFFNATKRVEAFRELSAKEDDAESIRLKMMAVLAGTPADVDLMLLSFLAESAKKDSLFDPVTEVFGSANLVGHFWKNVSALFGYKPNEPSLVDFVVTLFRAATPLETGIQQHAHAKVFLQRWKDSQDHASSFKYWSSRLEREMHIQSRLNSLSDISEILDADEFQAYEKKIIHTLCQAFENNTSRDTSLSVLQRRRRSFWYPTHEHGYRALEHAIELRGLLEGLELNLDGFDNGIIRYSQSWWKLDTAYRRFWTHFRRYAQTALMEKIAAWVEKSYVNNFLLPLADRWSDCVRSCKVWSSQQFAAQNMFFERYVQPFVEKGQKVFVVISDALRYEAAQEFAARLRNEDRWTCEVDVILSSLPSYTQLGMAALLPGRVRSIDADTANVSIDGVSSQGSDNRLGILKTAAKGRATALSAEQFAEMNTKTEGRALMRDHDVVYIYHNTIDAVGDSSKTEVQTFDAVQRCFDELLAILKRIAAVNATNMILTADHGFLFQQEDVVDGDMLSLPPASEWTFRNRRFSFGKGIQPSPGVKMFDAGNLGLQGNWTAAFPLSLRRFPLQGSGKRYVHGGVSLQEIVVPALRIHKARSSDTTRVEVDVLRVPSKITTGQAAFAFYQEQSVDDKTLSRTLRIGLFAKDGTLLSESKTEVFGSKEMEARLRETVLVLTLSRSADAYNNQEVELRLEEMLPGTNQSALYRSFPLKLQKPFTSDFDEF